MVLPAPVDAQIFAGLSFFAEAAAFEQSPARLIMRQAGGFEAMEPCALEREGKHELQPFGHVAVARMALADPIAEAAGLRDAAPHIADADSAEQRVVARAKEQEAVALIGAPIDRVARKPPPERAALQRIDGPA